jgi:hypothetical protein
MDEVAEVGGRCRWLLAVEEAKGEVWTSLPKYQASQLRFAATKGQEEFPGQRAAILASATDDFAAAWSRSKAKEAAQDRRQA